MDDVVHDTSDADMCFTQLCMCLADLCTECLLRTAPCSDCVGVRFHGHSAVVLRCVHALRHAALQLNDRLAVEHLKRRASTASAAAT